VGLHYTAQKPLKFGILPYIALTGFLRNYQHEYTGSLCVFNLVVFGEQTFLGALSNRFSIALVAKLLIASENVRRPNNGTNLLCHRDKFDGNTP